MRIKSSHSAVTTERSASRPDPACSWSRQLPSDRSRLARSSSPAKRWAAPVIRLAWASGSSPRQARSWLSNGSITSGRSWRAPRNRSRYEGNCSRPRNNAPRQSPRGLTWPSANALANSSNSSARRVAPRSSSMRRQPCTWCRLSTTKAIIDRSPVSPAKRSSACRAWPRQSRMAALVQASATVS